MGVNSPAPFVWGYAIVEGGGERAPRGCHFVWGYAIVEGGGVNLPAGNVTLAESRAELS
jgi:hypothetical protein